LKFKPHKPAPQFPAYLRTVSGEIGATMIEFALVSILFLALFLTFLDLAHYLAARAILIKAAQDALQIAVKSEDFQLDLSEASVGDTGYVRFKDVRNDVIARASSLPLATLISREGSGGMVELKNFTVTDTLADGTETEADIPVAILRPGEVWQEQSTATPLAHPYTMQAGERFKPLLRREPVIVSLHAEKRFFVPLIFSTLPLNVAAVGWVQAYPEVGFNVEEFLSNPDGDDPPPDDDDDPCEAPDYCTDWDADRCRCCSEPSNNPCFNGSVWDTSLCHCDCTAAGVAGCQDGWSQSDWDCDCKPCEQPPDSDCTGCWDTTTCSCDPECLGG
jgi:hypothetical protein